MALKFTRAIRRLCTWKRLENMARSNITEKHLREFENSAYKKRKGNYSEQLVKEKLLAEGHQILAQNYKTPFAEIDVLSQSPNGKVHIIEVKSLAQDWAHAISIQQIRRLQRAYSYLKPRFTELTLELWIVSPNGQISCHPMEEPDI